MLFQIIRDERGVYFGLLIEKATEFLVYRSAGYRTAHEAEVSVNRFRAYCLR